MFFNMKVFKIKSTNFVWPDTDEMKLIVSGKVDELIETARLMIIGLNDKFPSIYNERAINFLEKALLSLLDRKAYREIRGVEGLDKL